MKSRLPKCKFKNSTIFQEQSIYALKWGGWSVCLLNVKIVKHLNPKKIKDSSGAGEASKYSQSIREDYNHIFFQGIVQILFTLSNDLS